LAKSGPAIIVAAVVCGPGSILISSQIGAKLQYSAIWVLVVACVLMIAMVQLATRIGVLLNTTICQAIAERLGRPVAMMIGIIMFLIITCFQSSNNIAIGASLEAFGYEATNVISIGIIVAINAIVILFLYVGRHLYRVIEVSMKALVLVMLIAFIVNCVVARPSLAAIGRGLIPSAIGEHWLLLVALVSTTFSIAAAFYQGYLVREKDWTRQDVAVGTFDSIFGIAILGLISLVIMVTSAVVFGSQENAPKLETLADVANQLKPTFGAWAQLIFAVGILAGAISSFLVNALIGGHILADGCGLGERIDSPWTRHLTTVALLAGMGIAIASLSTGASRVGLIVFAQGLTVIGVPALALALIYLGIIERRKNRKAIPVTLLVLASFGFVITCLLVIRTVIVMVKTIEGL
jgi:manganese transport protein